MTNIHVGVLALLLSVVLTASGAEEREAPSRAPAVLDETHSIEARVADLLGRMILEEKVGQLRGGWPGVSAYEKKDGRVEIADAWKPLLTDAPIGLLGSTLRAEPFFGVTKESGLSRREGAVFLNNVQQYVRDHTRLRIPVFVTDDAHRGQQAIGATIFPQLCSMGPTWNTALQEAVGRAIALEMRSQGVTIAFAPNLDVIRDPRFGRSDQNFGEDPWPVAEMGKAAVRGFQGESARGTVDVTNTGKIVGDEVVQLYIRDEVASVARPPVQLRGFQRIHLQPGETRTVAFDIGYDELCFYGLDHKWIVEPGDFTIMIARSSRDIALVGKLTVREK